MDIKNILIDVFADAPLELQQHFIHDQEVPLLLNGKALTPTDAFSVRAEEEVTANLVGYIPLIFPEWAHLSWEQLEEKLNEQIPLGLVKQAKTFEELVEVLNAC